MLKALPERDRENSSALRGKRYCDRMFELEREFMPLTPEERFRKRLEQSKPVLDEFFVWAESLNAAPKTGVGIAAHYALSQRQYLERYLLDGRLEISNNRAERSIKPFVIDRKNFLFANTPRGATPSFIFFLTGSRKSAKIDSGRSFTMFTSYEELPLTMNATDVAVALRISKAAAYHLLRSSGFPTIHIGTCQLVGKDRFIKWMEKQAEKQSDIESTAI